jgi:anthranilate phosphoribosyltransferase
MAERMVGVLAARGCQRAVVVHGDDGLDELTTSTTSHVVELHDGKVVDYQVDPRELGLAPAPREALVGGDPATNADLARRVLAGEPGPHRDIVSLNAAAALVVAGLADDLPAGLEVARTAIDSGKAADALQRLVTTSNQPEAS